MAAHLMSMKEQEKEGYWGEIVRTPGYARSLEKAGPANTLLRGDEVVACIGAIELWDGRAQGWAVLADVIRQDFVTVHRATLRLIRLLNFRRLEITVAANYPEAIRWAEMMGFKRETPEPMQGYAPDGSAHFLYSRVK